MEFSKVVMFFFTPFNFFPGFLSKILDKIPNKYFWNLKGGFLCLKVRVFEQITHSLINQRVSRTLFLNNEYACLVLFLPKYIFKSFISFSLQKWLSRLANRPPIVIPFSFSTSSCYIYHCKFFRPMTFVLVHEPDK